MSSTTIVRSCAWIAAICLLCATRVHGSAADLARRLPRGVSCVAYINVESLLGSKLGTEENWRAKLSDAYAIRPLVVPPSAQHVVSASRIAPGNLEPLWEVSVIQVSRTLSMERIAKEASGFPESLGRTMAAWTPANAYFVRLDSKLLGVVYPADRQFAARWSEQPDSSSESLSPYLQAAISEVGPKTGYLFALDLQDAVSPKRVRRRLDMEEFDCLSGKSFDARKISDIIASLKGLKLTVEVDSDIDGRCVIEFGHRVAPLAEFAKPLVLEVLDQAGASIEDLGQWTITAKDTSILAGGKLSTEGLRRLCSVVNPPSPTQTDDESDASAAETPEPAAAASIAAQAAASKRYYGAVAKVLDGFEKRVRTAESLSKSATFLARDARTISRLPILNVDPELIRWGADVNSKLLDVASVLGVGGLQVRARAESVADARYNTERYTPGETVITDPNDEVDRRNTVRQRRAAVAEEKAKAVQQAVAALKDMEASRSHIRAAMTARYKIEF